MRIVRVRGKCVITGEWLYGDLLEDRGRYAIVTDARIYGENGAPWVKRIYEVDSKTVGQSTGLKDKNNVEVIQGDIVRCTRGCLHEVIWMEEYGGTFGGGMPAWYLSDIGEGYAWSGTEEIIGNIYDNPELLERS